MTGHNCSAPVPGCPYQEDKSPARELRAAFDNMPPGFQGDLIAAIQYANAIYRKRAADARERGRVVAFDHWCVRARCMEGLAVAFGVDNLPPAPLILGDFVVRS